MPAGRLEAEIAQIPALLRARAVPSPDEAAAAAAIRRAAPRFAATVARGSSDAVCEGLARALGTGLGLVTASLPPSLVTLDAARLRWRGGLVLVVSQSGASPDLVAAAGAARAGGALVVGIVNAPGSPLEAACHHLVPAGAGEERSVAATKSVVLSWLAGLRVIRAAAGQPLAPGAVEGLAAAVEAGLARDWAPAAALLGDGPVHVLGRGAFLGVAREVALKLKELAGLPAEAVSSAEFMHGPRAAAGPDTAAIMLAGGDPAGEAAALAALHGRGARVLLVSRDAPAAPAALHLVPPPVGERALEPLLAVALLYPLALAAARRRGRDPDAPEGLTKVTLTR